MIFKELKNVETNISHNEYILKQYYEDMKNSLRLLKDKTSHLLSARQFLLQKNIKNRLDKEKQTLHSLFVAIQNLMIIVRLGNYSINLNEIIFALAQANYITSFQASASEIFRSLIKVGIMPENVDLSSIRNEVVEHEVNDQHVSEIIEETKNLQNKKINEDILEDFDDIRNKLKALL